VIELLQRTAVPAPVERVWAFLERLDDNYARWHPEHLRWRTLRGRPLRTGTVWFADEWIGPLRIASRFFVVADEPGEYFAYRIGFPARIVDAGGSFRLRDLGNGECELIESAHLAFRTPLLGPLVDALLRAILPVGDFSRPMREEGEGLVKLFAAGEA
jgi:hypothetical protein